MRGLSPIFFKDFYKTDHKRQYPANTQMVYSNFTARESRLPGIDKVVFFGLQYFIKEYLIYRFNEFFFHSDFIDEIENYKRRMDYALGKDSIDVKHLHDLAELGFLPLEIRALPEGTVCPLRVPLLTIHNTLPEFYWLTNFLETLLSNVLWHPITSATIAYEYKKKLTRYAIETSSVSEFVQWQGHDFSMRGHTSLESSIVSGAAHLLSFTGGDTIAAIDFHERYYGANCEQEIIGGSVPATEHSVMCMGGFESEEATYKRLLVDTYPKGTVSIVSDTWDYWKVLTETLPSLKEIIMNRDGKLVIRPDSGDPADIICGIDGPGVGPEYLGTMRILWDIFGGSINLKGYKQLDPHIGVIYGDSITLEKCEEINQRLKAQGFASTNIVYGIGSYTYQYVTRDTFGFAVKSTYGVVDGRGRNLFKDPQTDRRRNIKKSACGLLRVNEDFTLSEKVSWEQAQTGKLEIVFKDGKLIKDQSLSEIRLRLAALSQA